MPGYSPLQEEKMESRSELEANLEFHVDLRDKHWLACCYNFGSKKKWSGVMTFVHLAVYAIECLCVEYHERELQQLPSSPWDEKKPGRKVMAIGD